MTLAKVIKPSDFTQAEGTIKQLLEARGYIVESWGYEHRFADPARQILGQINSPTSLYVRTTPDQVIIGSKNSLLIEIKDATSANIALEAFPILIQRHLFWSFGILTLYLFVNEAEITGEFVENLPIGRVIIPKRLKTSETDYWLPLLKHGFPNNQIERLPTGGSGDPFIIILNMQRKSLRHLEELL